MTELMPWLGLSLFLLVGLGVVFTGVPAAVVLLVAACFGAFAGAISGDVPVHLLGALPERLINLLENDLLQAIPLYVLMGTLINRLPLADALYRCFLAILPGPAAPVVSGIALGALLGPMNGSVGASVLALSRVAEPRLAASGISLPRRAAIITVASTLGVVVPPSLVLILLGDAMLNAHTIAVTVTARDDRVINTQDVFHGALVPAGLYFAACLIIGWWFNRQSKPGEGAPLKTVPRPTIQQAVLAAVTVLAILILLGGVAAGYFYAVEAAATGGFILLVTGFVSGRLPLPILNEILREALALTGALFFLLVAATTLTLVLRILGTDQLVAGWIAAIPGGTLGATLIVLAGIALSALVLDAFEIIFVVVPIVIPPLLIRVADARWVAVLVLLALQASFINPMIGYAVMMTRTVLKQAIPFPALLRSLLPYLFAQAALLLAVLLLPQLTHVGEGAADLSRKPPAISDRDLERRFEQMLQPAEPQPVEIESPGK
ncbi:MAG TPA: TRAP transporter large permease subunit [Xanthobacteraceae bacterium]|jgi:tripartite ATP-independent transporter DctM subunit|nr:TRAP transporter large permease subunit [Xanthobacteraceae bacterium]